MSGTFDLPGGRLILVDSTLEGRHGGGLGRLELEWLEDVLAAGRNSGAASGHGSGPGSGLVSGGDRPTLVLMHHPPFRSGLALMDEPFEGAAALAAIMARHPRALLCCGHLHLPMATRWAGGSAVVCPSPLAMVPDFGPSGGGEFTLGPPACLLHRLAADGVGTHFVSLPGMWPTGGPFAFLPPQSKSAGTPAGA